MRLRRNRFRAFLAAAGLGLGPLLVASPPAGAQDVARSEAALLRDAAALESRGDLARATEVLERLLERHPASSGGLFALERVLRARGTVADILPFADRYLEEEPRSAGTRYLKLRVMVEVDSLETLEAEARRWIESDPSSADPWREAAGMYERAFGPERALALLEEGRRALDAPDALALEIGDVLLEMGRASEAVDAWSRAIGPEGDDAADVLRRLEGLDGDRGELVRPLVAALDAEPTTVDRRRAGVRIALESGLEEEAVRLADLVLPELAGPARRGFLTDLARRGEDEGASGVAVWAYGRLRDLAGDDRERRALDVRIVSVALAAGDTALALDAQDRLARGLPAGSVERRRAVADLIRVEAGRADPGELARRLDAFRDEFPDAPELDELAAAVAVGLQTRGEEDAAARVLAGVDGPRSSVERGYLLLERGEVDAAREAFGEALQGLSPTRATPVIQLVGLLGRLGPSGRSVVADAAVLAHRGRGAEAVQRVRSGVPGLPADERAAVLAQGARTADAAGLADDGAELRRELLAAYPDAPEVGEATLALARHRAGEPGGVEEAVRLLENLIVERPTAPVVPDARRELERLRRRVGEAAG